MASFSQRRSNWRPNIESSFNNVDFPLQLTQSWKKIIDLDLKDRDHLIDLDLLGDLDHCW